MKIQKSFFVIFALLFAVGCSTNKTKENANDQGPVPAISNEPMNLGPQGSDSGKIAGLTTIHFSTDRSVIEKNEISLVRQNADWIKSHPDVKIQIEGHCDERGSIEYNLALGDRRAKAVFNQLIALGIPKSRLTTISYGEERPIAQESTEEAYSKNRRANFVPLNMDIPKAPLASTP